MTVIFDHVQIYSLGMWSIIIWILSEWYYFRNNPLMITRSIDYFLSR